MRGVFELPFEEDDRLVLAVRQSCFYELHLDGFPLLETGVEVEISPFKVGETLTE